MDKLIKLCLVAVASFSSILNAEKIETPIELEASGSGLASTFCSYYGLFFASAAQTSVQPDQIIAFTDAGTTCTSFELSVDGGIILPWRGSYRVTYAVQQDALGAVALFADDVLLPLTTSAAADVGATLTNTSIITLNANQVLTLNSIESTATFNTLIPSGTSTPSVPVNLVIEFIGNYLPPVLPH